MDGPPIEGGEVTSAAAGGAARIRRSYFLVTVNTNKRESHWAQPLRDATEQLTGTHAGLRFILRFLEGTYGDITRIQRKYSIEKGGTAMGGRVHTHILLQFTHTARLQLDFGRIKEWYFRKLGLHVHVDVKLITTGGTAEDVEAYIAKNPLQA